MDKEQLRELQGFPRRLALNKSLKACKGTSWSWKANQRGTPRALRSSQPLDEPSLPRPAGSWDPR